MRTPTQTEILSHMHRLGWTQRLGVLYSPSGLSALVLDPMSTIIGLSAVLQVDPIALACEIAWYADRPKRGRQLHIVVTDEAPVGFKIQHNGRSGYESKVVKRYRAWQNHLGEAAKEAAEAQGWRLGRERVYRIGVAVFLEPIKSGRLTKQGMDWTNFHKGHEDALCRAKVLPGDSAYYSRGPTAFLPPSRLHSGLIAPGVYVRDAERGAGIEIWIEEVSE